MKKNIKQKPYDVMFFRKNNKLFRLIVKKGDTPDMHKGAKYHMFELLKSDDKLYNWTSATPVIEFGLSFLNLIKDPQSNRALGEAVQKLFDKYVKAIYFKQDNGKYLRVAINTKTGWRVMYH